MNSLFWFVGLVIINGQWLDVGL